jgi:hypothetical protein
MRSKGLLRAVLLAAVCAVHAVDYYEVLELPRSADEQVRADALPVHCPTCPALLALLSVPVARSAPLFTELLSAV